MTPRKSLPSRRNHITQKVKVAGQRTVYISVDDDTHPAEIFLRVAGPDVGAETIALYDSLARVISLALQHGAPLEQVSKMLCGVKVSPAGICVGHPSIHFCSSVPDLIGQHLLIQDPLPPRE